MSTTAAILLTVAGFPGAMAGQGAGRLAPPADVRCDRNQLTSHSGTITAYETRNDSTRIQLTTSWGAVESFAIAHPESPVEEHFLIWGKPFSKEDWTEIADVPNQPRSGVQVIVWVCGEADSQPVVDWRPVNQVYGMKSEQR